jgi:hypothetical protein
MLARYFSNGRAAIHAKKVQFYNLPLSKSSFELYFCGKIGSIGLTFGLWILDIVFDYPSGLIGF